MATVSNPDEFKKQLRAIFSKTETANSDPYTLPKALAGEKSGYTVGVSQIDIGQNGRSKELDKIRDVIDIYAKEYPEKTEKFDLTQAKADLGKPGRSAAVEKAKSFINDALSSQQGRQVIDGLDNDNLEKVKDSVDDLVKKGSQNPNAADFLNSDHGQMLIADWVNRTGEPTNLQKWIKGEDATLNGKPLPKLEGTFDAAKLYAYEMKSKTGTERPKVVNERFNEVLETIGQQQYQQEKGFYDKNPLPAKVKAALSDRKDKSVIDALKDKKLDEVATHVQSVVDAGKDNEKAREFLNSDEGLAAIAASVAENGKPSKLLDWVQGKEIRLNSGKVIPAIDGKLDASQFENYQKQINPTGKPMTEADPAPADGDSSTPPQFADASDPNWLEGDDGNDTLAGGEGLDQAADDGEEDNIKDDGTNSDEDPEIAADSPEMQGFWDQLRQPLAPEQEIMLAPPESWSNNDVRMVQRIAVTLPSSDPQKAEAEHMVRRYYEHNFGTDSSETDATGRLIPPPDKTDTPDKEDEDEEDQEEPGKVPPPSSSSFREQGRAISSLFKQATGGKSGSGAAEASAVLTKVFDMGRELAFKSGKQGLGATITGLQIGLNMLRNGMGQSSGNPPTPFVLSFGGNGDTSPQPSREPQSPTPSPVPYLAALKEDGSYGPKTHLAVAKAMAGLGEGRVREGAALGEFANFARKVQGTGNADGLSDAAANAFGGLFPASRNGEGRSLVAQSLQDSLNDTGPSYFSDWTPLKTDGVIGPKTASAFGRTVSRAGADSFIRHFGSFLGFL